MKKLTTQEFIEKARSIHGDKYDYTKSVYKKANTKITIICKHHGEFSQKAGKHLFGQGCKKCANENQASNVKEFLQRAKEVHGDKYDYSKVVYKNCRTKISIMCKYHGIFEQIPSNHLKGQNCPRCGKQNQSQTQSLTKKEFIKRAKKIHGNKYDYSKSVYKRTQTKLIIVCKKHGDFLQTPNGHLNGKGCRKCYDEKQSLNIEKFVQKAKAVHGDKYDYSKAIYKKSNTKIKIICPSHGQFEQTANHHLSGKGCPNCRNSKGESAIFETLTSLNVDFITEKRFKTCRDKRPLPFDFYIPSKNLLIEYNGEQHYFKVKLFNKNISFNSRLLKDRIKRSWCKENNMTLLVIPYTKFEEINDIILKNVC